VHIVPTGISSTLVELIVFVGKTSKTPRRLVSHSLGGTPLYQGNITPGTPIYIEEKRGSILAIVSWYSKACKLFIACNDTQYLTEIFTYGTFGVSVTGEDGRIKITSSVNYGGCTIFYL